MGKGRAPCCDKSQVKRGPWSPSEDLRLITFIQKHGHENWRSLPKQAGLLRCGKSCRLRWINYLRPDVKRGNFTKEEEETITRLHDALGNKWSKIASYLPGRTDNEIKNVWNTHLKKRLVLKTIAPTNNYQTNKSSPMGRGCSSVSSSCSSSSSITDSCGRGQNRANELELEELKDTHRQGFAAKQSHELEKVEIVNMERPNTLASCSISSNNCDASILKYNHLIGSSFDDLGGTNRAETINRVQEVNKPDVVEIPFESDTDFWDMLDGLDPFQSNNAQVNLQGMEACPDTTKEGDEHNRWFHYLDKELGLENQNYQGHGIDGAEEIDPETGYFHAWPSSPQSASTMRSKSPSM